MISQVATISGLGGVGKSELARKYAYKYGKYYGGNVIWINAENFEDMKNSFLRLARNRLGIFPKDKYGNDKTIETIVREVYAFFARRRSLFIFDNVQEYKKISKFLPFSLSPDLNKPHILITSRNKDWGISEDEGEIKTIQLGVFKETEALKFVKRALNIRNNLQDEEIKNLTEELQYFPLALKQAVAYINEKNVVLSYRGKEKIGVSDYLKRYEEEAKKLLDFELKNKSDRYTKTTFITWKITIDAIAQKECGFEALSVLEIMAYLAPDKIRIEEIFSKLIADDEEKLWNAVKLLDRYSMIDLKEGVANIHRLVQKVTELNLQKEGREEEVLRKALELINSGDSAIDNFIHVAFIWGHASKHNRLIDEFYFNSIYGRWKYTPLHSLAESGDCEAISAIITHIERHYPGELVKTVNVEDNHGQTLLHIAAYNGKLDVVEYLISKGADFSAKDKLNSTPLHSAAAEAGKLDIVKYLVNRGADVNAQSKYCSTPLHYAAESGELDKVKCLIDKGADINAKDGYGWIPLHCAAESEKWDIVKYLISKGANVNAKNKYGWTPLHYAAGSGELDIVKCLIKNGTDVNAKNEDGNIPLHHSAVFFGSDDIAEYLIREGANVDAKNKDGNTPLHLAAEKGKADIAKILLKHNADVNARSNWRMTALHYAVGSGELDIVKCLIKNGTDVNAKNEDGYTPLHLVAKEGGRADIAKVLLKHNADVNARSNWRMTALHYAIICENLAIVEFIVEKGADINARDRNNNTPLHFAAMKGKIDVVKILLEYNADVNTKNNEGRTALHYAANNNYQELVECIRSAEW
ncbi:ankyrin repeat domain-containing protein [Wolbachia endosymbiont (group A) of Pogonocherus hispidulus]|uniref:ankyrin repeat domain-containing protein n=1 Tax=Wolbachia endosymbiont (group A) of Pogonocherus hispidulus TaxID=3066136 RepID=UPI003340B574